MTRERPILLSGEMLRALLDGRKTQTRRVIKLREFGPSTTPGYDWTFRDHHALWNDISNARLMELCPYGKPGDLLFVKERWRPAIAHGCIENTCDCGDVIVTYRADGSERFFSDYDDTIPPEWTWPKAADRGDVPSIHMPRWASRITLEVTEVRAQRVQEISEDDAVAEGAAHRIAPGGDLAGAFEGIDAPIGYRAHFRDLWDRINADRGFPWESNPWTWAVSFRVVSVSGREVKPC